MNEKIPPKGNNADPESELFFQQFPLAEEHRDKAELAFRLRKICSELIEKHKYPIICKFASDLRVKYKDAPQYFLYHMIIGSTGTKTTKFDFPGEDSIEKFLRLRELMSRLDD